MDAARDDDGRARVTELIRDARICMLTTMDAEGRHVARPMGLQEAEFDGDLWFFTDGSSPKLDDIRLHPEVNVSFSDQRHAAWVSIAGRAEAVQDRAKAAELWSTPLEAWFPDGLETPGLTLLRVRAETAEYWDAPGSRVTQLLAFAKAKATGERPDIGENRTVDLA